MAGKYEEYKIQYHKVSKQMKKCAIECQKKGRLLPAGE
jgi:hypothetical protein